MAIHNLDDLLVQGVSGRGVLVRSDLNVPLDDGTITDLGRITASVPTLKALADAGAAIAEFGWEGMQGEHMVAVENSSKVHNLVVCTLCSCYPWPILGLPPVWYKSAPYRSRAVIDPRGMLREFGLELPEDVELRVWDSTAEVRYLVLPERPAGTEGMSEEALAELVTRDAMVGVANVSVSKAGSAA